MVYAVSRRGLTSRLAISSLAFSVFLSNGCKKDPKPNSEAPRDLHADLVGCASVTNQGCELPESRTIKIALPHGSTIQRVSATTAPDRHEPVLVSEPKSDAGRGDPLIVVEVAQRAASKITIDAVLANGVKARTVAPVTSPQRIAWLEDARKARSKGEIARAKEIALAHANAPDPIERALAKGFLARVAVSQARVDEAFPLFREAIALHRAAGRISDEADDSFALAFALHQRSQRYTEARAAIDAAANAVARYPEGRAREPYYRGTLAAEIGDHRRALDLLREAEALAHRFGMVRLERNARSALALEMQEMGRLRAAVPILDALRVELDHATSAKTPDAPTPCERVEAANNRGWAALLVNEAVSSGSESPSPSPALDARQPLEEALAIEDCTDAYARASALANLARVAFAAGDLDLAQEKLDEATKTAKEPRGTERLGWIELRGRILLSRGKNQAALTTIDEGLALARASLLKISEWSLLTLRGEILASLHRAKDAREALEAAEDALDEAMILVPLGEGRGTFTGSRSRSARALFGLLVEQKQARAAARAAQRAQGRLLASVERSLRLEALAPTDRAKWEDVVRAYRAARSAIDADAANDWKLPADQLAKTTAARVDKDRELRAALESAVSVLNDKVSDNTPSERDEPPRDVGVLDLDVFPDLKGFIAIANETAARVSSSADLAKALNEEEIRRSRRVRVRAWGAWRSVDIHALPLFNGEPLIAHVPVEYAIGLSTRAHPQQRKTPAGASALVIGDPSSDLPAASDEAEAVAKALPPPVKLLLRDQATSTAVIHALREVDLLHYAGHGVFAGEEGFESALPLANRGRLTVGDILALDHVPRTIVLAGCEAAKSTGDAEGLGLAQAFLAAGASHVLAPIRKVPDKSARVIATALWSSSSQQHPDFAARARDAIVALRKEDPASDWAAFRVLVP